MSETRTKIQEELKTAMKSRDQHKVTTLRGITAAIKQVEVDTRSEVDEAKVVDIIQKEVKKRRETIKFAEQEDRPEIVEQNKSEMEILQSFLGSQLSEDELRCCISDLVSSGADSIGKVMGALNKDYKGRFDGRVASEIIKEKLA